MREEIRVEKKHRRIERTRTLLWKFEAVSDGTRVLRARIQRALDFAKRSQARVADRIKVVQPWHGASKSSSSLHHPPTGSYFTFGYFLSHTCRYMYRDSFKLLTWQTRVPHTSYNFPFQPVFGYLRRFLSHPSNHLVFPYRSSKLHLNSHIDVTYKSRELHRKT